MSVGWVECNMDDVCQIPELLFLNVSMYEDSLTENKIYLQVQIK